MANRWRTDFEQHTENFIHRPKRDTKEAKLGEWTEESGGLTLLILLLFALLAGFALYVFIRILIY